MTTNLPHVLAELDLAEAGDIFDNLVAQFDLVPSTHQQALQQVWETITQAAADLGLETTGALAARMAGLVAHVTGHPTTRIHTTAVAGEQHLLRNTITAVLLAAAEATGVPETAVLDQVIELHPRTRSGDRPLTDDEILVLRLRALANAGPTKAGQQAAVYTLCDLGMSPKETTATTIPDLHAAPGFVQAPGANEQLKARHLPAPPFHHAVLEAHMPAATRRPSRTLTYSPVTNAPGSNAASASASGVLDRFMAAAKIKNKDVSASSVRYWRLHHAYLTGGPELLKQVAGCELHIALNRARVELTTPIPEEPILAF